MPVSILELPHARIERERVEKNRKQELKNIKRKLARRLRRRRRGFEIDPSITVSLERKLERLQSGAPTFEEQTRHFIKRTLCQLLVAAIITVVVADYEGYFDRLSGPRYITFTGPGFTIVGCKERERVSCEKNPQDREGRVLNVKNLVAFEAQMQGVPLDFALAVAEQESGFTCNVISTADAMGVLQILYPTAVAMGFRGKPEELLRCHNSAKYGIKYLKAALEEAGGDLCLAANKYYAGTNSGFIASGREYCLGVLNRMQHYKNVNIATL
ncbi:MAG TPA: transglycosylase SLT domain-containing protein [Xanthobacteraceae bacterium]|nr:transglycosylase SLT domain-containing protein [Xanthobacteraceae bacterium]